MLKPVEMPVAADYCSPSCWEVGRRDGMCRGEMLIQSNQQPLLCVLVPMGASGWGSSG